MEKNTVQRKSYTAMLKLEAVNFAKEKGNREAVRKFNVGECSVWEWKEEKIVLKCLHQKKRGKRSGDASSQSSNKNTSREGSFTYRNDIRCQQPVFYFTVVLSVTSNGGRHSPLVAFKRKTAPKGNFPKRHFDCCE
ncbi:unnamed protein product [Soboliphyme baturini]|uniref:Transposase n=1 Tax=Soboliphyme baturini TaxID=241478 RepID=A0A183J9D4_9BILA|nr:unnamed protein product [Soboliphyme baturini]